MRVVVLMLAVLCIAGCSGRHAPRELQHVALHTGEAVRVPTAGARCEASAEGGIANLFCTHIGRGGPDVVFYRDSVLVWRSPDDADSYPWAGRPSVRVHDGGQGSTTLLDSETVSAAAAGTRCVVRNTSLVCTPWPPAPRAVVFTKRAVAIERGGVRVATYRWAAR